jgi:hypothetical protein
VGSDGLAGLYIHNTDAKGSMPERRVFEQLVDVILDRTILRKQQWGKT